jgi:hypothetical protein
MTNLKINSMQKKDPNGHETRLDAQCSLAALNTLIS